MKKKPGFSEAKAAAMEAADDIRTMIAECGSEDGTERCRLSEMAGFAAQLQGMRNNLKKSRIWLRGAPNMNIRESWVFRNIRSRVRDTR